MTKDRISYSFAKLLQQLMLGEELRYSKFSSGTNRKWVDQFIGDHALSYRLIGNQQKKVFCEQPDNLRLYLHTKFGIPVLEDYIDFWEHESPERSRAVLAASDSKLRKTKVFSGFLVNSYEPITCSLQDAVFIVQPLAGAYSFVASWNTFVIPEHVTVIVVEGHENFREIDRQKYLFEGISPLFVWRYQNSNAIADWLNSISNPYLHFGDFDLKGIHIYQSEFKSKIKGSRGGYVVPSNLEHLLITYGEKELHEKQKHLLTSIQKKMTDDLQPLLQLLLKHKKGLEQEILIQRTTEL